MKKHTSRPMDFTLKTYHSLLTSLQKAGFEFQPMENLPFQTKGKIIVLRHDVDLRPEYSLHTAMMENSLGIKGTYYFRIVPESNRPDIIRKIAGLEHEAGYHYEDLSLARGNMEKAYESFCRNLEYLRSIYPVKTICMHGSPLSQHDNRDLWKQYNYRPLGIVCEPYLDIDFSEVFYLTDTGRRWDGWKVSMRDKTGKQEEWIRKGLIFRSTAQIIRAANEQKLPDKIMLTIHPQRWTNSALPWMKELMRQSVRNLVKKYYGAWILDPKSFYMLI